MATTIKVTPQECIDHVKDCIMAGLTPMIWGDPGIGKSDITRQVCKGYRLYPIDIRLSQLDPTELNGFPAIGKDGKASHIPMNIFPLEGDPIPKGYDGWCLFFDEFNSASLAVQAAAYKVILDHCVGQYKLHKRAVKICAGNMMDNNAIVQRQSTAMQSRLVHLILQTDVDQWVQWANKENLDHRVIAYIQSMPNSLHKFDPDHDDHTFACPRTWEFTSDLIKRNQGVLQPKLPLLAGTISEPIAREFVLYTDIYNDMPTIQDIIDKPDTTEISNEPGTLYALSNLVASWVNDTNAKPLIKFVGRLPIEFATVTLQNALNRDSDLAANIHIAEWIDQNAVDLFY